MNILFLGYWNLEDPLTVSTIFPHLQILRKLDKIGRIIFSNIQREPINEERVKEFQKAGIIYRPLFSKNWPNNLINKISDFILFPKIIRRHIKENHIQLIIARGAPAGALAYLVWKKTKTPFIVESFEPHAEYMLKAGIWSKLDPRYIAQKYWDIQQKRVAKHLITVSKSYKNALISEKVPSNKVSVAPCAVDFSLFNLNPHYREKIRGKLKFGENAIIGVYTGKFGGLYYDIEAFEMFKRAFDFFGESFALIILSSNEKSFLKKRLKDFQIPEHKVFIGFVEHAKVPNFLNAADFAFAPIKKLSVSAYQSPVKIGEYWACGLPVILTCGIGDESEVLESEMGGALIRDYVEKDLIRAFRLIKEIINEPFYKERITKLAAKYRSIDGLKEIYYKLLVERLY